MKNRQKSVKFVINHGILPISQMNFEEFATCFADIVKFSISLESPLF